MWNFFPCNYRYLHTSTCCRKKFEKYELSASHIDKNCWIMQMRQKIRIRDKIHDTFPLYIVTTFLAILCLSEQSTYTQKGEIPTLLWVSIFIRARKSRHFVWLGITHFFFMPARLYSPVSADSRINFLPKNSRRTFLL